MKKIKHQVSRYKQIGIVIGVVLLALLSVPVLSHTLVAKITDIEKTSPELNLAEFSPKGPAGGAMVPASCSVGVSDAEDGFAPCPTPVVTIAPAPQVTIPRGGYVSWSYSATNAYYCDVVTSGNFGVGVGDITSGVAYGNFVNIGPFFTPGYKIFTVTCRSADSLFSDTKTFRINVDPDVRVKLTPADGTGSNYPWLKINSFVADTDYVFPGDSAQLSWNVTGATSCVASGAWTGAKNPSAGAQWVSFHTTQIVAFKKYTLTCSNSVTGSSEVAAVSVTFEGTGSSCFISGTRVRMADGSLKNIELIQEGEYVATPTGKERVSKKYETNYTGEMLAINGGDYFVTTSHPFMSHRGWVSLDPAKTNEEHPELIVSRMQVGDTLVMENGFETVVTSLDTRTETVVVYNLGLEHSHEYYADGFLVHNKAILVY